MHYNACCVYGWADDIISQAKLYIRIILLRITEVILVENIKIYKCIWLFAWEWMSAYLLGFSFFRYSVCLFSLQFSHRFIPYMNEMRRFRRSTFQHFQFLTEISTNIKHVFIVTFWTVCMHSGFHPLVEYSLLLNPVNLCENRFCITFAQFDTFECVVLVSFGLNGENSFNYYYYYYYDVWQRAFPVIVLNGSNQNTK